MRFMLLLMLVGMAHGALANPYVSALGTLMSGHRLPIGKAALHKKRQNH